MAGGTTLLRAAGQAWGQALASEHRFWLENAAARLCNDNSLDSKAMGRFALMLCLIALADGPGVAAADAQRSGVAAEAVQQATKSGTMLISEAQMILGVKESAPYAEVMKVGAY